MEGDKVVIGSPPTRENPVNEGNVGCNSDHLQTKFIKVVLILKHVSENVHPIPFDANAVKFLSGFAFR